MTVQKFEYKTSIWAYKDQESMMNFYGKEGWELVTVMPGTTLNLPYLIYKRPLP